MYDAAHTFAVPCSQAACTVVTSAGTLVLSLLITLGTQSLISIFFPKSWITSNAMRRLLIVGSETLLFYLARFLTEQEEGIPSLLLGGANPARRPGSTLSHRPVQGCSSSRQAQLRTQKHSRPRYAAYCPHHPFPAREVPTAGSCATTDSLTTRG